MKAGIGRRLFGAAKALAAVMLLEHGVYAAYVPSPPGAQRADVIEYFGGYGELSWQATRQGWLGLQPLDSEYGVDLRSQHGLALAEDCLNQLTPRLAVIEFPCRLWGRPTTRNYAGQARRRRLG